MAVQTPISGSVKDSVVGDIRMSIAKFASVGNNDTYTSDLTSILGLSCDAGSTGATIGATWSGGVVTFLSSGASITNVSLVLFGF